MLPSAFTRTFSRNILLAKRVFTPACVRNLTVNQVSTALRPFYFQVHPDLFGQYPRERSVNEESLKLLSEYLANVQATKKKAVPTTLTFFVKRPDITQSQHDSSAVKAVNVTLHSQNVKENIEKILQACNLSLDYVSTLPKARPQTQQPVRDLRWDTPFYQHYGKGSPYIRMDTKMPKRKHDVRLSPWVQKNARRAREKTESQEAIKQENEKLKQILVQEAGVLDVRWECGWSIAQFRASLKGFLRLLRNNKEELKQIRGHNLIFGNQTGICIRGDVILRKDDVPDHWLQFLKTIHKHDVIINKIPACEKFISTLLGGIQIVRPGRKSIILAETYLMELRRITISVKEYLENNPHVKLKGPLDDLELVIESATGPTAISPTGKVIVPSSSPGFLVVNFIEKNFRKARQIQAQHKAYAQYENNVIEVCKQKLGLKELTRGSIVTAKEMQVCCERLLQGYLTGALDVNLEGCVLKVDSFYSVMSDGEMHIPWDWIDDHAE